LVYSGNRRRAIGKASELHPKLRKFNFLKCFNICTRVGYMLTCMHMLLSQGKVAYKE